MYGEFVGLDDFGKTVFLTREEAEAALKKREEGAARGSRNRGGGCHYDQATKEE